MKFFTILLGTLIIMLTFSPGASQASTTSVTSPQVLEEKYTGYAFDLVTNKLVYIEKHTQLSSQLKKSKVGTENNNKAKEANSFNPLELSTRYVNANGDTIASRLTDFRRNILSPTFELKTTDHKLIEGFEQSSENSFRIYHKYQENPEASEIFSGSTASLVADAGFIHFIQKNWLMLMDGQMIKFNFIVPSQLKPIKMRVEKVSDESVLSQPAATFKLSINNRLFSWFVEPIFVSLHQKNKSLLQYRGLSNIPKNADKNYEVRIDFPTNERTRTVIDHE